MREYRTLDEVTAEYFINHPNEVDEFLTEIFEDYAADGDSEILFAQLKIISQVRKQIAQS